MRPIQLRWLPGVLLLILIYLQYRLWLEPGGIREMVHLKKEAALQAAINEKLQKRNDALLQQVEQLQKNQNAVEGRARQELGMIKKGETFYQVVK